MMNLLEKIKHNKNAAINFGMVVVGILFFFIIGKEWLVIEDDSPNYIYAIPAEGIMPMYPLLIYVLRVFFGNRNFLCALVVFQSFFGIISTQLLTSKIVKIFRLKKWEAIIVYILLLFPFAIYLPDYGVTHMVMTEGIAYSLANIYFCLLLSYLYERKSIIILWIFVVDIALGLTRSQLLLFFPLTALIIGYIEIKRINIRKVFQMLLGLFISGVILLSGIVTTFGMAQLYRVNVRPLIEWYDEVELASIDNLEGWVIKKLSRAGQINTLLKIKAYYEAEPEDAELFSNEEEKELFLRVYKELDKNEYLHKYSRKGLYCWIDYTKDRIPFVENDVMNDYFSTHNNTSVDSWEVGTHISLVLLKEHWLSVLLHSARIMLMSLVASVFFQIEKIYLLCHIIAVGLYLALISLGIRNRKKNAKEAKLAFLVIGIEVSLVVLTNLLLNGVQRYVVYGMGLFYCALYINLRSLWVNKYDD